ncbi:hypothetical protein LEP1GSC124_3512 [Leptospira interrogans serovar Pyrogenes str. 200701872]|uniref:Uncharacterized protein n=1 Tax=Leptospira interrogans serovar Pyrogenes str. 200701872 TaxID=1193029 RepID=M6ZUH3_LEPIR|nr:hypothetical protein LEP1GSC124_3512 [Leptospira interrogans serovar Pyrogenes str. 200701872]
MNYKPIEIGFTFVYIGMIIVLIQGGVFRRLSGKVDETKLIRIGTFSLLVGFLFYTSFLILINFLFHLLF